MEEELIIKAKKGDEGSLEALLFEYDNMLRIKAHKYYISGMDEDDIYQESIIAFLKAVDDYNSKKGSFKSFANLCIDRHLANKIKQSHRQKNKAFNESASLDANVFASDDSEYTLKDYVVDR